jgi:hypothetical protein
MAYIKTIPPSKATGPVAEAYKYSARVSGQNLIPKIVRIFSLRPETMKRILRVWELGMWVVDEPRAMVELVAAGVSRLNNCHY